MRNCVGAWHVGRVLDTKAARHDPYAGGPARHVLLVHGRRRPLVAQRAAIQEGAQGGSVGLLRVRGGDRRPRKPGEEEEKSKGSAPSSGGPRPNAVGSSRGKTLTNAAQPCLQSVLGAEFGRKASQEDYCGKGDGGGTQSAGEAEVQEEEPPPAAASGGGSRLRLPRRPLRRRLRRLQRRLGRGRLGRRSQRHRWALGRWARRRARAARRRPRAAAPPWRRAARPTAARGHVVDAARAHGRLAHRRGRRRRGRRRARAGAGRHVCRGHQRWRRRRVQLGRRPPARRAAARARAASPPPTPSSRPCSRRRPRRRRPRSPRAPPRRPARTSLPLDRAPSGACSAKARFVLL